MSPPYRLDELRHVLALNVEALHRFDTDVTRTFDVQVAVFHSEARPVAAGRRRYYKSRTPRARDGEDNNDVICALTAFRVKTRRWS